MKIFVALATIAAISAVAPANAQSVHQKNAKSAVKNCWVQTDSSRLTGYYDVCTDTKIMEEAPRRQLTIANTPPSTTVPDSPRDSGGDGGGGGGGGQR